MTEPEQSEFERLWEERELARAALNAESDPLERDRIRREQMAPLEARMAELYPPVAEVFTNQPISS
jgi:hypothetical protein